MKMNHQTIKGLAAIAVLSFAASGALAADFSPELQDLIKKANAEGELQLSWSQSTLGGASGAREAETEMNKLFGTNIKVSFSPGR